MQAMRRLWVLAVVFGACGATRAPTAPVDPYFQLRYCTDESAVLSAARSGETPGLRLAQDLFNQPWVLLPEPPMVTEFDIDHAEISSPGVPELAGAGPYVRVHLLPSGQRKLLAGTESGHGRQMCAVVNGTVTTGATIEATFSKSFEFSLEPLSLMDANAIVRRLNVDVI